MQAYSRQRENKQEAYFNLGRAAHQLGLLHLAVPWYYRALAAPVPEPYQGASSLLTGITFPPPSADPEVLPCRFVRPRSLVITKSHTLLLIRYFLKASDIGQ